MQKKNPANSNTAQNTSLQVKSTKENYLFCTPIPVKSITFVFLHLLEAEMPIKQLQNAATPSACRETFFANKDYYESPTGVNQNSMMVVSPI